MWNVYLIRQRIRPYGTIDFYPDSRHGRVEFTFMPKATDEFTDFAAATNNRVCHKPCHLFDPPIEN